MKKSFVSAISLVFSAILLVGILLFNNVVIAQNSSSAGHGFQISPVLVELNADPGKQYTINIVLKNITTSTLATRSQVNDFGAKNEVGDPEIFLDERENRTYSLKSWVDKVPSYTLKSQESKTIPVTINIPADAEPGGHYGVVRFTGVAPELSGDDNAVSLSGSIGTLVLVRVSGDIKESIKLEEFFAAQGTQKSSFFEKGPINLVERIKNTGNVHIKPTGTVVVKDMFGKTKASLKVNEPPKNILPDSIRRFEQEWNKKWLFGRYTADLNLAYGTTGQVLTGQLVFWVIPWKLIIIVLLSLIALFFILRFAIKKYNTMIARKYNSKR